MRYCGDAGSSPDGDIDNFFLQASQHTKKKNCPETSPLDSYSMATSVLFTLSTTVVSRTAHAI